MRGNNDNGIFSDEKCFIKLQHFQQKYAYSNTCTHKHILELIHVVKILFCSVIHQTGMYSFWSQLELWSDGSKSIPHTHVNIIYSVILLSFLMLEINMSFTSLLIYDLCTTHETLEIEVFDVCSLLDLRNYPWIFQAKSDKLREDREHM